MGAMLFERENEEFFKDCSGKSSLVCMSSTLREVMAPFYMLLSFEKMAHYYSKQDAKT